jgi:hypothetical protein
MRHVVKRIETAQAVNLGSGPATVHDIAADGKLKAYWEDSAVVCDHADYPEFSRVIPLAACLFVDVEYGRSE